MSVGIILPTIPGREAIYKQVLADYVATTLDVEIVTPVAYASVGEAWNAGAKALQGDHEYLHFAIDDCQPWPGWLEAAVETVQAGYLPAARQEFPDGTHDSHGSLGLSASLGPEAVDWTPCRSTGIPFTRTDWWQRVGEFLPIHYYCDDDWYWRAACAGIQTVYREAYAFTHHHKVASSVDVKANDHKAAFIANATRLGPLRPAFQEIT